MVKQTISILGTGFHNLNKGYLVPEGLLISILYLVFKLTNWGISYAAMAVAYKLDLMATAAVITAVAGIPVALLTLLLNKYQDIRNASINSPS